MKQIYGILREIPGIDKKKLRKQRVSNEVKINHMAKCSPTKDSIVPILFHILERFLDKRNPHDEAERKIFDYLHNVDSEKMEIMKSRLVHFKKMPEQQRQNLFSKEFLDLSINHGVSQETIIKAWLSEGLILSSAMSGNNFPEVGQVRPWDRPISSRGIREFGTRTFTAPWPYICAVSVSEDYSKWYRNEEFLPKLEGLEKYEIAQDCKPRKTSDGGYFNDCKPQRPKYSSDPGSGFSIPTCDGGERYRHGDVCLRIPQSFPGQGINLRGFNFFSKNCKIKLTNENDPALTYVLNAMVYGDPETSISADCSIKDVLSFAIPENHPNDYNQFVPGRYVIQVIVPNDVGYMPLYETRPDEPEPLPPKEFMSNSVILDIQPNPKIGYRVWNDWGHCYKETDGGGADEIWLRAAVGIVSKEGTVSVSIRDIPRYPWNDMDTGEDTRGSYNFDFFNETLPFNGAVVIGLTGFEVDSETAAEEGIDSWDKAYGEYLIEVGKAVGIVGGPTLIEIAKGMGLAAAGYAAIIIAVIVLVTGIFWAEWAPADWVASDFMILNAVQLHNLTDAKKPLPPADSPPDSSAGIYGAVTEILPLEKAVDTADAVYATYTEERKCRIVYDYYAVSGEGYGAPPLYLTTSVYGMKYHCTRTS